MSVVQVRGVVRNGLVELSEPLGLPDGSEVVVRGWTGAPDDEAPPTPDEIVATLRALDALEPLEWTDDEVAAWEAERRGRREREKAALGAHSDTLRKVWE